VDRSKKRPRMSEMDQIQLSRLPPGAVAAAPLEPSRQVRLPADT